MAVGSYGSTLTSSVGGASWTRHYSSNTSSDLNGVSYGQGSFVAVGYDETIITSSDDGVNWTPIHSTSSGGYRKFFGVTYANNTFATVGFEMNYGQGVILTSSNEVSSTDESTELSLYNLDDDFPENVTVAVSSSNTGEATVDTTTLTFTPDNWMNTQTVSVTGVDDDDMDGHREYKVGLSAEILTALSAGTNWVDRKDPNDDNPYLFYGVSYGNGIFVAVGDSGVIYTSSEGSSWVASETSDN